LVRLSVGYGYGKCGAPGFVEVISILIAFDASLSGMMKALMNLDADAT